MDLRTFYRSQTVPEREAFASAIGTTPLYYRNLAHGFRQPSATLALAIERESQGRLTVADMRPAIAAAMDALGYRRRRSRQKISSDGAKAHGATASRSRRVRKTPHAKGKVHE